MQQKLAHRTIYSAWRQFRFFAEWFIISILRSRFALALLCRGNVAGLNLKGGKLNVKNKKIYQNPLCYSVRRRTADLRCGLFTQTKQNEKVLKQIINNPDSYPQLSFAEFNTLINGKTGLSAAELPRDKACDTGDNGYDFTRYIVGGEFIFSCYINSKKPDQSMYSLSYFENGSIVDEVYGLQKFPDFLKKYGK